MKKKNESLAMDKSLRDAIFGITCHLDRISEDITEIGEKRVLMERS